MSSSQSPRMSSSQSQQVRASHLLIKHSGSRRKASWKDPEGQIIKNTSRDSAVAQLKTLREEIITDKARFEDLASRYSDCSSAKRGGDLDFDLTVDGRKDSEKTTSADDTRGVDAPVSDILERIALSDDSTHLILNEFLLAAGTDSNKAGNAALSEDGGRSDSDNILYGVFRPPRTDVELLSWVYLRKDRLRRGMEIFQKLKKEFDLYRGFCKEKFKHQCYMEAFSDLEDLCLEEIGKREQDSVEYVPHQNWEAVLRKRQEELAERKDDPVLIEIGRDAISTILKEYQASNVTSNNKEDLRIQDNLHQVDEGLVIVIGKQKLSSDLETSRFDARIMQKLDAMQQLERELEVICGFDYREVMLLLVKKFVLVRLEDIARKDAKEKSDAASEALLLELELEAKSNVNKRGGDDSKQIQAKSKKTEEEEGL